MSTLIGVNNIGLFGGNSSSKKGKKLPYDAEIEYLESTGTQYIDTGVVLDATMTVRVLYDYIQNGFVFGARASVNSGYSGVTNESMGTYNIRYGNKNIYAQPTIPRGTNDVIISPIGVILNGATVSSTTYGNDFFSGHCFLFTINNNGQPLIGDYAVIRIIRFSIDNIIDLIPVRVGTTGYMYDKVSGELFGNSGTGDFILGPDVGE